MASALAVTCSVIGGAKGIFSIIKFILDTLDSIQPVYGKEDYESLKKEAKLVADLLNRASKIESADLHQLLEEHTITQDLKEVKEAMQETQYYPVASNVPANVYAYEGDEKTKEEAYHRTMAQCLEHPADRQVRDTFRNSGACTKDCAVNHGVFGKVLTPIAPVWGLILGANDAAKYTSHKREVAHRLGTQVRKMKSIRERMSIIFQFITAEKVYRN